MSDSTEGAVTPADARTFLADYAHDAEALKTMPDPDVVAWHGRVNGAVGKVKATASDWRSGITNGDVREFVKNAATPADVAARAYEMRKQLSTAIIRPGKDAKPEAIAAYRKAMDIPDDPKGYAIARPAHIDEEAFKSDVVQRRLQGITAALHAQGASRSAVAAALDWYWKEQAAEASATVEADKAYAASSEAENRKKWPGAEYDQNIEHSNRAARKAFGDDFEAARQLQDKAGRFLLDNPVMVRAFAALGREMSEGGLGGTITDTERETLSDQIRSVRGKIAAAKAMGDNPRANELYQNELALIAQRDGDREIVGAKGRVA